MKIKYLPQDFIVNEKVKIRISKNPTNFLLFKINKKNITTFKAVNILNQTLKNILKAPIKTIFLGLKDKYSFSTQYFCSILQREKANNQKISYLKNIGKENFGKLNQKNLEVKFLGFLETPLNRKNLHANHFKITLRDIDSKELDLYLKNIETIRKIGIFLNYFDYQRVKVLLLDKFSLPDNKLNSNECKFSLRQLKELLEELKNVKKIETFPNKENFGYHFIKNRESYISDSLKFNIMLSLILLEKSIDKFQNELNYKAYLKQNVMLIPALENPINYEKILKIFEKIKEKKIFDRKLLAKFWNMEFSYQKDEINNSRYKISLEFFLEPGSYATCLIKHIIPYPHFSTLKYKPILIY